MFERFIEGAAEYNFSEGRLCSFIFSLIEVDQFVFLFQFCLNR